MAPIVVKTIEEVRVAVAAARGKGRTIGLVPTMGALHAGHASLLRAARNETGFVVLTIFVNPMQFGPAEDFSRYPRTLAADLQVAERERTDLVFVPEPATIYPPGFGTQVEVLGLQDGLCGASRPGHFRGVATVVLKLFNIVQPDCAYFGQKDAQQVRIIEQMVQDLNVPVQVRTCPIVREPDGLALSSRNQYLSVEQRSAATVLYQALRKAEQEIRGGSIDAAQVKQTMMGEIQQQPGAVLDYAEVVDARTLKPVQKIEKQVLLAVAVKFGTTRLIDNLLVEPSGA